MYLEVNAESYLTEALSTDEVKALEYPALIHRMYQGQFEIFQAHWIKNKVSKFSSTQGNDFMSGLAVDAL